MSFYWKLNGRELNGATVRINPDGLQYNETIHQNTTQLENRGIHREQTHRDKPQLTITINHTGKDNTKYNEIEDTINALEESNEFTLEAPVGVTAYVYKDEKRVSLSLISYSVDSTESTHKVTLRIEAYVNGVWIADNGTHYEEVEGYFDYDGADYTLNSPLSLPDQDGDNTGSTPIIKLPEQTSGYPLAIRASDYAWIQLTVDSTETDTIDGRTITYENFDLTGYLVPAPASGEGAPFMIRSSPTSLFLGGGE